MKRKSFKFVDMTIREALVSVSNQLQTLYDTGEASNIAEMVVEHVTQFNRSQLIINKHISLAPDQQKHLENICAELLTHKPVQYVLGETWFMGLKFFVNEHVLIPRPETEELVDLIVRRTSSRSQGNGKILDIGTGSGCIAVSLKKLLPGYEVHAIDISREALDIASKNAVQNNCQISFHELNILDESQWLALPSFDIIVSNPPYIPLDEIDSMSSNVINFEPHIALFVDTNDPLIFYKAIVRFAENKLASGGTIYFEIHENAAAALQQSFSHYYIEIKKDLQGKDRMMKVSF